MLYPPTFQTSVGRGKIHSLTDPTGNLLVSTYRVNPKPPQTPNPDDKAALSRPVHSMSVDLRRRLGTSKRPNTNGNKQGFTTPTTSGDSSSPKIIRSTYNIMGELANESITEYTIFEVLLYDVDRVNIWRFLFFYVCIYRATNLPFTTVVAQPAQHTHTNTWIHSTRPTHSMQGESCRTPRATLGGAGAKVLPLRRPSRQESSRSAI